MLVADDREGIRNVLRRHIKRQKDMEIIAYAETGQEAIDLTLRHNPDVLVLDIQFPDISGVEVCCRLRSEKKLKTKILGITGIEDYYLIEQMLKAGASSFLHKSQGLKEAPAVIRKLMAGVPYSCPTTASFRACKNESPLTHPSLRQLQILQLLDSGLRIKQIADQLSISENTVKTHIRQLKKKLGEHTLAGLAKHAPGRT